jgi:hypothetical protein
VKDGAVNATSKDAVNGSQLNTTNNKVVELLGGGAGYNNITNSFTNPTYKVDGKDYNNVGGAVDALNKADQALGNRITNLGDRLEQAFTETNQRIDGIEKKRMQVLQQRWRWKQHHLLRVNSRMQQVLLIMAVKMRLV